MDQSSFKGKDNSQTKLHLSESRSKLYNETIHTEWPSPISAKTTNVVAIDHFSPAKSGSYVESDRKLCLALSRCWPVSTTTPLDGKWISKFIRKIWCPNAQIKIKIKCFLHVAQIDNTISKLNLLWTEVFGNRYHNRIEWSIFKVWIDICTLNWVANKRATFSTIIQRYPTVSNFARISGFNKNHTF